ncbi:unnamed protein product [Rotaria sp. Silwood1]|nr:unnamed protein product [Rotaria sp. Silwood1]CAF1661489.1 unnamed protein product [Rotaria sp. Silwood1]CAF3715052.1 unnamed protein product [Rotaria sp. Silwood1]CAF3842748.1 unnamed protein product [Rotaria sp. Silwood1]CAF3869730.1 unnamed protein product [Rotaria sp. Silwood1]
MLDKVQLSNTDVLYLTERLQMKEHMNREDTLNTIVELEHFYTFLKNNNKGMGAPSPMVDKAWHHHILNTKMYNTFSHQHFGIEILHHVPFWSGNIADIEEMWSIDAEPAPLETYNGITAMLGVDNVNKTVWLISKDDLNRFL